MRNRERQEWMELVERERDQHRTEVARLLDRIQHPERVQVQAAEMVEHEPPEDAGELAKVGMILDQQAGGSDAVTD